MGIGDVWLA